MPDNFKQCGETRVKIILQINQKHVSLKIVYWSIDTLSDKNLSTV